MDDEINYNDMVEKALLEVVRESLRHVAKNGLPGDQHFYITFKTHFPGVDLPSHLAERYKDDMTIVLQHQFWDVIVEQDYFSVDLSFNHNRETLTIPFAALTAFADPSVQFGLQFTSTLPDQEDSSVTETEAAPEEEATEDQQESKPGEVIALDAFRKK
ncbi:MAG: ClpXP protease specificity-enhancing factor SspB [Proteobacteria bacterium]|nr:ClpXP protease specificity-enhancing factor SspB [Pseudomonadota bacterium]